MEIGNCIVFLVKSAKGLPYFPWRPCLTLMSSTMAVTAGAGPEMEMVLMVLLYSGARQVGGGRRAGAVRDRRRPLQLSDNVLCAGDVVRGPSSSCNDDTGVDFCPVPGRRDSDMTRHHAACFAPPSRRNRLSLLYRYKGNTTVVRRSYCFLP